MDLGGRLYVGFFGLDQSCILESRRRSKNVSPLGREHFVSEGG